MHDSQRGDMESNADLRQRVAQLEEELVDQRRIADELRQENDLLHSLIDTLPDYVYLKDMESRFVLSNKAHLRVLGVKNPADVQGKTDFDIFPPELAAQYYDDEQELMASGRTLVDREESTVTPNGRTLWISTTKAPLRDREGRIVGLAGMSRDITERKAAQEALAESFAELERLAYMVSHEMQEPLNAIAGDLGDLEARLRDRIGDVSKGMLGRLRDASAQVQALGAGLLSYSRLGTWGTVCGMTDSQEVVDHVVESLQDQIQASNATITYADLPEVYADTSLLYQLFLNLIANAINFRGAEPLQVQLQATREEAGWRFCIFDNGIGFDASNVERVFEPFQRLRDEVEPVDAGVGLATCRRIAEKHGGRIWAESEPGKGSTFCFTLPDAV